MSSAPTSEQIARDATWLLQALDPAARAVRLIAMHAADYRAASFLDDRMMQGPVKAHVMQWSEVGSAIPPEARRDARWIFHIGHVGSTLVARLLGEIAGVLSVREPRFLRDVTVLPSGERPAFTDAAATFYSRTFSPDEVALVKATSFVSELAAELVPAGERALMMYASPRNYIASILAGENSVRELRMLAPLRAERLGSRVAISVTPRNDAELAALAWACEMTSLEAAAQAMPDREVGWADFDEMLGNMPAELSRVAGLLSLPVRETEIGAIADGPLMSRYSKALEYDYSAQLRQDLIAEALEAHGREIGEALAMLRRQGETSPLLKRALDRAGEN